MGLCLYPSWRKSKRRVRQCANILIVFGVSGIWHGVGFTYILWGILHGIYQVLEIIGERIGRTFKRESDSMWFKGMQVIFTFGLVTLGWMLFRAQSVEQFVNMVKGIFSVWNPEAILDGNAYYKMGLSRLQTIPLIIGISSLFIVDLLHEKHVSVRKKIAEYPIVFRWVIYLTVIMFILIFGTYGPAYAENQFIYGKF